ncbi:MAG TPA: triose-phosphate isomerase [Allosphingosinicella sp.]|uniref:triose-phosphate isomerase n=1 Tax=Allosphingosinicella sp. TaxID=2823234 RepID=UPI002F2710DB
MRRKLVVGNWKMNGSLAQLKELGAIASAARNSPGVDVAVCPPFTLIAPARARSAGLAVGAQDCHGKDSGAFTGSVSAAMLKEAGARLIIVGHSERRAEHRESDAAVRSKAEAALRQGLQAIVCVGESDEERRAGRAVEIVSGQLAGSLPQIGEGEGEIVVAYEPIWAIGTGNTATPQDVAEMHAAIRAELGRALGGRGGSVRILYGGSVKPDNAAELFAVPDVDGALVGGASLTAKDFVPIIEAAAGAGR